MKSVETSNAVLPNGEHTMLLFDIANDKRKPQYRKRKEAITALQLKGKTHNFFNEERTVQMRNSFRSM